MDKAKLKEAAWKTLGTLAPLLIELGMIVALIVYVIMIAFFPLITLALTVVLMIGGIMFYHYIGSFTGEE